MEPSNETQFALIHQELSAIQATLASIEKKLEHDYVTQDQFKPVKLIVYGFAGLVLAGAIGALLKLVFIPK